MLLLAACLAVDSVVHLIGTCGVTFSGYPTYQIRSNSVAFVKARTLASCELTLGCWTLDSLWQKPLYVRAEADYAKYKSTL